MRNQPLLPPLPEELRGLEVHELVRDYPELLQAFREAGIRLREEGTKPVPEELLSGGKSEGVVLRAVEWRRERCV